MSYRFDNIILASASPRRSELLSQLGLQFTIKAANIDEGRRNKEPANQYVLRMAQEKAVMVFNGLEIKSNKIVIGADTCIALGKTVLGKPKDEANARAILKKLSGRTHRVLSSVCLVALDTATQNVRIQTKISKSEVTFRSISENEIGQYWKTGEPVDKAGAYAIQGRGAVFIKAIHGSYSGVVGLPLYETAELLLDYNIQTLADNSSDNTRYSDSFSDGG